MNQKRLFLIIIGLGIIIFLHNKKEVPSPKIKSLSQEVIADELALSKSKPTSSEPAATLPEKLESNKKEIMSDEEFIAGEIKYAQQSLFDKELGYCEVLNKSYCQGLSEIDYPDNQPIKCITQRKYCNSTFYQATESELLDILSAEAVIYYQIEREKTENYIKDPVANGTDMYDENYYKVKLQKLDPERYSSLQNN